MKCTTNRKIISKLFGRLAWCWICINVLDIFIMLLRRKNVQRFFSSEPIIYFSHFVSSKNMIFGKTLVKKKSRNPIHIYFKKYPKLFFSNRIGLFWFRFPPVLFARGYWFCGSSMGWGLRPRGYSGTRRYVREYRLYAVEGFTGTNSLYGFRMGEGGFGAPPGEDVIVAVIWDLSVIFLMRLP